MAQKSFAWTYRMLMRYFEPDPERSEQALQLILRLLSGPDPPADDEKMLQPSTVRDIVYQKNTLDSDKASEFGESR